MSSMTRDRSGDALVAATLGSAYLEGVEVPAEDVALAEAYAAGEIDATSYVAEVQRRIAEDVPAARA